MMRIEPNAYVTLEYTLRDDEGELLDESGTASDVMDATDTAGEGGKRDERDESDESDGPIRYVHGYGMLVPGLESALLGLGVGEKKSVVVSSDDGFGPYDEDLLLEVARDEFPDPAAVSVGDEFVAESPEGDSVPMRVVEVLPEAVIVDANHPLAGVTLHYDITVTAVRKATEEEIAKAMAEQQASEVEEARASIEIEVAKKRDGLPN